MHNVYAVDYIIYSERILLRRLNHYIVEAGIAILPSRSDEGVQSFMDSLHNVRAELTGEELPGAHLDEAGLMGLKERLASESKAIAVK